MVGIDTIRLQVEDYEIDDDAHLAIRKPDIDLHTGEQFPERVLYHSRGGNEVKGVKAYGNFDVFNVGLFPHYGGVSCFVQTSIPRFFNDGEDNIEPISNKDTIQVIESLGVALGGAGIHTNLWNAKVSRIDTFSNLNLNNRFDDYAPLMSTLQAKRKARINYGVSTFLWYSGQSELTCYDKVQEVEAKKTGKRISQKKLLKLDNRIARFEHRFKTKKSLSRYGLKSVSELKKDGLDEIKHNYINEFKTNIFKKNPDNLHCLIETEVESEFTLFAETHGRYWLDKLLKYYGLSFFVHAMPIDRLKLIVYKVSGGNRNKAYRFGQELDQILKFRPESKKGLHWKKVRAMYIEMKTKFLSQSLN